MNVKAVFMVQPRIQWALILSYLIFRFPFKFFSLAGEIRKTNTPAALHICPKCTYFWLQPVSSQSSPLFASLAIPFDFCSLNCDAFDLFLFCWVFFGTVFCQPVSWYLPCFIIIFGCAGICCCSLLLSTDYLLYCLNFNAHRSVCDAVCFLINALYWFVCVCDNLKCTAALQAVKRRKKSMPFRHFRIISAIWMRRQ